MISKTPQKKACNQSKSKVKRNNSFSKNSNQSIFWGNPQLERSIFKPKHQQALYNNNQQASVKKSNKGALGMSRKYAQQDNIFKKRLQTKQYREVVISEQFVRSSKLYKMLRQQIAISDAKHVKQMTELQQVLKDEQKQTKQIKNDNHQMKLQLWQLRNQLFELKSMYQEEQQQNNKLVEEYQYLNGQDEEQEEQFVDDEEALNDNQQPQVQDENQQNGETDNQIQAQKMSNKYEKE